MATPFDPKRISIRPAAATDLGTLLDFRMAMMSDIFGAKAGLKAGPQVDTAALREDNRRWLDEHFGRDFVAWIADLDGRAVGSAAILWIEHPPGHNNPAGREAYILNVYTRPEARRMGLARALMERLVAEGRAAGAGRIWLRASDEGRPLYEAIGFTESNYLQLAGE